MSLTTIMQKMYLEPTEIMGMRCMKGTVATPACIFNEGAMSLTTIMQKMYLEPTEIMLAACHKNNLKRITKSDKQTHDKMKRRSAMQQMRRREPVWQARNKRRVSSMGLA